MARRRARVAAPIPVPDRRLRRAPAALALGAALLVAACTTTPTTGNGSGTTSTTATSGSTPAGTTPGTEAPSPLPPVDEAAVQAAFDAAAGELLTPGAAMTLVTPDGTSTFTYGTADWAGTRPVSADDHIRIGSVTKTWTATVILQMVQEGVLTLGDPVSAYMPDVPNGDAITIEQLLSMRSGLYNYTADPDLSAAMDADPQRAWRPDELLDIAFAHEPVASPGERFDYSNTNTVLLGLIAEQLDGNPLELIFEDRIFAPLGLDATSFPAITSSAIADPHADGYMFGTNVSTIETAALPPEELASAEAGTLQPTDFTNANPSWAWSAGAGMSVIDDLVVWAQALTGDHDAILDADTTRERLDSIRPMSDENPDVGYGWGLARFGPMYGHTGELPGYNTFMANDPVHHVTLVVWANLAPDPTGVPPATTIARALIPLIYGGGAGGEDVDQEGAGASL